MGHICTKNVVKTIKAKRPLSKPPNIYQISNTDPFLGINYGIVEVKKKKIFRFHFNFYFQFIDCSNILVGNQGQTARRWRNFHQHFETKARAERIVQTYGKNFFTHFVLLKEKRSRIIFRIQLLITISLRVGSKTKSGP